MAVKKGAKKKKPAVARPSKAAKKKTAKKTVKNQAAKTVKKKAKKAVAKKTAKKTVKRAVKKAVARKAGKAAGTAKKPTTSGPKEDAAHLSPATKKRYALLKAILLKKRNEVVEGIEARIGRKLTVESGQKVDSAMDSADMSSHDVEQGMDYSLLEMKYEQYKDIADAFRKLENVSFGLCEECGEEIDIKRLEVNPLARYCIACKTLKENLERIQKEETRFKE
jgi:DnaK suppressor protein